MASRFQAAALVASPSYPNAVAWSDENLVAVASGHIVTILNPAMPFGARGLITVSGSKPFSIGLIESKDLLADSMLPIILTHDVRPSVRSISWSPIGLSPNSGCLLAVCTTEGRVKLYRLPFCEFSAEWVEVMDISEMLYTYLNITNYGEISFPSLEYIDDQASKFGTEHGSDDDDLTLAVFRKKTKRRRKNALSIIKDAQRSKTLFTEVVDFPLSHLQEGSSVEVLIVDGNQHVWVAGKLYKIRGGKALVNFMETDGNGKPDKWVQLNSNDQENCSPGIRPFMDVGNFPKQMLSSNWNGVDGILKVGQTVEAWINQRWVEGMLMGVNGSALHVTLNGDIESVMVDIYYVRLAPRWNDEKNSWQVTVVKIELKDQESIKAASIKPDKAISLPKSKSDIRKQTRQKSDNVPYISAEKYASRSAMLTSLVVAWSPAINLNKLSNCCSILAVGGKSGQISFWRVSPRYYSIMQSVDPTAAVLIGLVQAHNSFITAINWAAFVSDPLKTQYILATGSSDGSLKVWRVYIRDLLNSSEDFHASFSLLKEVSSVGSVPVSVLSLTVPVQSQHQLFLAVGKTSGSLEVWTCDISTSKFDKACSCDAHDHIVTGLSWAFNGKCLYSSSQDNAMHCWILHGNSLHKVPMPSNTTGVKSSTDVPNVFDACYGLALSPGNLALAVVRRFDASLLHPMYQARAQKAAVEFFWIGGQKTDSSSKRSSDFNEQTFNGFDHNELINWEHNIYWSLNQYENPDNKPLVVWDIVAALLAFENSLPKFINYILSKWLNSFIGRETSQISKLTNLPSRHLHLLNVIGRRVVLKEAKEEKINGEKLGEYAFEEEERIFWSEILEKNEKELRERLVGFSFRAVIDLFTPSSANLSESRYWVPLGLAQMARWVAKNRGFVKDELKQLASKVKKMDKSKLRSITEYKREEKCTLCSSTLQFGSPEEAICSAVNCNDGTGMSHRLNRCSVTMQVTPVTPSWICVCCHRYATKLIPSTFLSTPTYTLDCSFNNPLEVSLRSFCPFCGILLQRLQPEFLLSATPV